MSELPSLPPLMLPGTPPDTGRNYEHYLAYEAQGRSPNQDVGTPMDFLEVVNAEFPICFDLAATNYERSVAERFFAPKWTGEPGCEGVDSLNTHWPANEDGWLWLNPPFANIRPWAEKVVLEAAQGCKILFLVPASVDSTWYYDCIQDRCEVRFLRPRLTFVGHTDPYKKPMMLCIFEPGRVPRAWQWIWRAPKTRGRANGKAE